MPRLWKNMPIRRRLIEAAQEIIHMAAVTGDEEEPLSIGEIADRAESAVYRVAQRVSAEALKASGRCWVRRLTVSKPFIMSESW
jgi:replicative DNA helicase